jgi:hypothetical protein
VSDPTSPTSDNDDAGAVPANDPSEPESGPIDVNELLESTRKLFEPEQLQRSMEQAGYTPDPPVNTPGKPGRATNWLDELPPVADRVDDESAAKPGDRGVNNDSEAKTDETTPEPRVTTGSDGDEAVDESVDEPASTEASPGEAPLKGVNVLSIVALVLALALSPLAVIFGYIALGQTRRARQRGETLALWAIGLGWVVFAAWLVLIASLLWIGYQQGITLDSVRELIELFSLP